MNENVLESFGSAAFIIICKSERHLWSIKYEDDVQVTGSAESFTPNSSYTYSQTVCQGILASSFFSTSVHTPVSK